MGQLNVLPAQCCSDFDDHHDATVLSEVSLLEGCSVLLNVSKVGVGEFAASDRLGYSVIQNILYFYGA